ncbi:hypothetical protein FTW19_16740 [Terriglobus albidus]|uniref:Lipoprotein n=1 Tax=Terriglobus albidus TaxID=1592106 RepID=A0A5B9ECR6_9BACT|nr:hypothetical protein [Terriglobus albidus]QEE29499.1 hypothetical protein FTW19_16740 [Terriglobus albidus]
MTRRYPVLLTLAAACIVIQGCKHSPKAVQAATAPVITAPPIQVPPATVRDAERRAEADIPAPPPPAPPKQEEPQHPPKTQGRRRPQTQPTTTPPPTQSASTGTPAPDTASVIGELSTGGDTSAQARQQAAELIAATQRRLEGLSGSVAGSHKTAVDQIKDFLLKAREALKAGDVDGANTLTTKAKLLLDDIAR